LQIYVFAVLCSKAFTLPFILAIGNNCAIYALKWILHHGGWVDPAENLYAFMEDLLINTNIGQISLA